MRNALVYTQGNCRATGGGTIAATLSYARTPPRLPKYTRRGVRRTRGAIYYAPPTASAARTTCVPALNAHTIVQGGGRLRPRATQMLWGVHESLTLSGGIKHDGQWSCHRAHDDRERAISNDKLAYSIVGWDRQADSEA